MQINRKLTETDIEHMEAVVRDSPDEKLHATLNEVNSVYAMHMMMKKRLSLPEPICQGLHIPYSLQ